MKSNTIKMVLMAAAALCLAYFAIENINDNRLYRKTDAYALAYGLKPLSSSGENELRLWVIEPMEGGVAASIFAENGAVACQGKSQSLDGDARLIVGTGSCRKSTVQLSGVELEKILSSLGRLKRKDVSCENVMDGWGLIVEGVVDHERFAFESWNPDACELAGAKTLSGLLESIGDRRSEPGPGRKLR